MGLLTAELPNGTIHSWRGRDLATIATFLDGFHHRLEQQVSHDSASAKYAPGSSIKQRLDVWVFGMTQHVLTTPAPPATQDFRKMFLTYRLLTLEPTPESGHLGKTFADLLPSYDLEFRLAMMDGNFVFDYRLWPLGTASEIRLSDWANSPA